ncbi:SPOR domain-containing protein [Legionella jordanis]|uniref:Sporulation domain-containing protein n=1 Tax=Legionella jordanis TaxID=456 RepID=A0A0W0V9J6_9GAMM|nr:SPOR domain-containing protein [Legionella jordanis]KTD16770.1 Sporulation domain-containing protein [Legionella jordanis]RMX03702.1 SPOR domain-containing protein [Legionella jordanis]RMX22236.1 SPOR domain-containing protein [Legionella jordanis]VEH11762.1 Sporulation domain-containing protein [Legionella jordanis]HAT8712928.1 SPOR domain-containing protein [Legionella jordanis]
MARDYGRRRPSRQKSNTPKQFAWSLAAFLCGYITANVFDYTSLNNWLHKNVLAQEEAVSEAKVNARKDEIPKPKFEFYTLLSKDSVPTASNTLPRASIATPAKPAQPPANTAANQAVVAASVSATAHVPAQSTANDVKNLRSNTSVPVAEARPVAQLATQKQESYLLQMASFKSRQEAERLKAVLTLRGFDVSIVAAPPQQGGWFRVILGPFSSKVEAERVQMAVARTERIRGMLRKLNA